MTTHCSARGSATRRLQELLGVDVLASVRNTVRAGIACAMLLSFGAQAETLSLGSMTLFKTKGQPTYAEITISGATQGDSARLRARVASPEAYRAAGLRYAPALSQITVSARPASDGRAGLRLDIPDAASEGSLDLLLLVGDAVSVAMAEYRLDFTGTARVFPALEAGTALIPTGPQATALASSSKASTVVGPGAPIAPVAKASVPATRTAAAATSTPVAAARPAATIAAASATAATSASTASIAKPASTSVASPSVAASGIDTAAAGQAAAALAAWADAWSRRDVDAYIAMYTPDFTGRTRPPSHATWVAERRARIESKHVIEVRVSSLSVIPRSNLMVLTFNQTYAGDGLRQTSRKRLTMRHVADRWLIQEESELP